MLIAQGDADNLVVPTATQGFVSRACAVGDRVTYRAYPGASHLTIANQAVPAVLSFFAASLSGSPPPSTC